MVASHNRRFALTCRTTIHLFKTPTQCNQHGQLPTPPCGYLRQGRNFTMLRVHIPAVYGAVNVCQLMKSICLTTVALHVPCQSEAHTGKGRYDMIYL